MSSRIIEKLYIITKDFTYIISKKENSSVVKRVDTINFLEDNEYINKLLKKKGLLIGHTYTCFIGDDIALIAKMSHRKYAPFIAGRLLRFYRQIKNRKQSKKIHEIAQI